MPRLDDGICLWGTGNLELENCTSAYGKYCSIFGGPNDQFQSKSYHHLNFSVLFNILIYHSKFKKETSKKYLTLRNAFPNGLIL